MQPETEMLEASGIGVWSWRVDEDAIFWSTSMCNLFGVQQADVPTTYEVFLDLIHDDDRASVSDAVATALAEAARLQAPGSYRVEHRVEHPDGSLVWIEGRGRVVVDVNGNPVEMLGTAIDITRRKTAEADLRKRKSMLRLYTELASDYVYRLDMLEEGWLTEVVAGSFERTTGYTLGEVEAAGGWVALMHPDDRADTHRVIQSWKSGEPCIAEYRIVGKQGEIRWFRDRMRPTLGDDGEVKRVHGAVQDITENKSLEQQLIQARKHEALARFSGNVAHDFNNLLTVIFGSVDIIDGEPMSDEIRSSLDAIENAAERASNLTRGMMLFARRQGGKPRLFEIHRFLEETVPILKQGLGSRHHLHLEVGESPGFVRLDAAQAQLMLLNMVVNSRDAISDSGNVWIRSGAVHLSASDPLRPPVIEPGDYITISVEDDGEGIEADVLPKVFEPFFSTRGQGAGTGMGLAACLGIAMRAEGGIAVESTPHEGTTFTIYLPAKEAAVEQPVKSSGWGTSLGGDESILVVDDEPPIRRLFNRVLVSMGYDVATCEDAESAIEMLQDRAFDLIVSDVVMPGMGGIGLVQAVSERWPDTPIILVSGNADACDVDVPLLAKPLTPTGLARSIREMLDA